MSDKIYKDEKKAINTVEGRRYALKNWHTQQQKAFAKHQEKRNRPFVFIDKNKRFGKQK
jgi:hypothetical protein